MRLAPLAIGVACHLVKLGCTSRAWRNVLAAAYPEQRVRWRSIFGAYLAGVGVNAVFPARAGDVLRLYLTRRAIPTSSYTTTISSTLVLTILDTGLRRRDCSHGPSPGHPPQPRTRCRRLPSFDFSWLLTPRHRAEVVCVTARAGAIFPRRSGSRTGWRDSEGRVAQAFTILRRRHAYLRSVAAWQACDWALRLATIWFFLGAFHIHQSRATSCSCR